MMVLQFFIAINFKCFDYEICLKCRCHEITQVNFKSKLELDICLQKCQS